jgi:hypothetical protein
MNIPLPFSPSQKPEQTEEILLCIMDTQSNISQQDAPHHEEVVRVFI